MKRILFCVFFLPIVCSGQFYGFSINFNSNDNLNHLYFDTIGNPNNIWQIGIPDKPYLNHPSWFDGVVTDTVSPYPANDTSSFVIWAIFEPHTIHDFMELSARYSVNSDTLNDFGKIEFSADLGSSWILISDDTVQYIQGTDTVAWPKMVDPYYGELDAIHLSGTSTDEFTILFYQTDFWGTDFFNFQVDDFQNLFNLSYGDTLLYKFTFISDGNTESLEGLLFDDIYFKQEYPTAIDENEMEKLNIFPNPVSKFLSFPFDISTIQIFSSDGVLVYTDDYVSTNQICVESLNQGLFFIHVTDLSGNLYSAKFVKH